MLLRRKETSDAAAADEAEVPEAAFALALADRAAAEGDTLFVARSETRLDRLVRACAAFCAGRAELLVLPPWDVLPYDRSAPSPGIVGRRVATLARLAAGKGDAGLPRLLLVGAGAALQLVPPPATWAETALVLTVGDAIDEEALRAALGERGYHLGEAVAEPGEVAFRGQVIDLFSAGDFLPARLSVEDGRIAAIQRFDPASQRSIEPAQRVDVHPATEFPLDPHEGERALVQDDAPLPLPAGRLVPVFDYTAGFAVAMDAEVEARWGELRAQAEEAYEVGRKLRRVVADPRGALPPPGRMFLSVHRAMGFCAAPLVIEAAGVAEAAPRQVGDLVRVAGEAGEAAVVIAGPGDPEKLARALGRRGLEARAAGDWTEAAAGGVACARLDIAAGFRRDGLLVLQAAGLVRAPGGPSREAFGGGDAPRVGDIVVHAEHGAARLVALKAVESDGQAEERLALAFAGDSELLVEVAELDRIWRYGTEGSLDRIDGEAWRAKRAEIEAEIAGVAEKLADQAAARAACAAPVIAPPRAEYGRLARRFPYALSGDQRAAVEAVLDDLEHGTPMNRLVCGDVGFGKTEVALRAAAAAALSGWQVAVVAPTTVLARQHLETFRRRFAGTAVRVEPLGAGTSAGAKAVRAGLADGSVGVVVGTQALASEAVRFKRLGLVVIDEEQRFGEAQKQALTGRRNGEACVHTLVMTATPIPRTLQMAMVGLREVSVIATAPVARQATRTMVLPFDPIVLRDAVMREQARGGQSFVVCPRIADLAGVAAQLAELAPRLQVVQAHGRMKAEALEAAVVGFAAGEGDVLLATNIIEAGLDIPRANTIVVMHPDRFGLAQLHQIRGRVGRGARRGTAYLLTDPGRRLARATVARLRALESLGSLGAGVAISVADLDQRGAGELFGDAQAGHVTAMGTELYQHLLLQAVRARQGEAPLLPAPVVRVGLAGVIPDAYVPEADLRIALYRRVARAEGAADVEALGEELVDRFGALPGPVEALLLLGRLRCLCARAGVAALDAGPRGVAVTPHAAAGLAAMAEALGGAVRDDRVVVPLVAADAGARVRGLVALFSRP